MPSPGPTIPVALRTREERRRAERFVAAMPVSIEGEAGTTQDLSSGGLCFIADRPYEVGSRVDVVIEYLLDGHQYPLRCEVEVVRVEASEDGYTIGARLSAPSGMQEVPVGSAPAKPARPRLRKVD